MWLVKNLLPAVGVAFLAGPPSAGKSYLALELSLALAMGGEILGRRARASGVVYVCAEGQAGMRARIKAWRDEHGSRHLPFQLIAQPPNFLDSNSVDALLEELLAARSEMVAEGHGLGMVVIDTMAASAAGADENASSSMSLILAGLARLSREINALVLVVAHVGKDEDRGIRGWSGQLAAADTVIMLKRAVRDPSLRVGTIAKQKDGRDGERFAFRLSQALRGADDEGDIVTSCSVRFEPVPAEGPSKKDLSHRQRIVLSAVRKCVAEGLSESCPRAPDGAACVARTLVRERALSLGYGEGKIETRRRTLYRDFKALVDRGQLGEAGDHVWISSFEGQ